MYVFAAGTCFASELSQDDGATTATNWRGDINQCIEYLDQLKSRNIVAQRGAAILRNLIS